jgi:hypothetical protein
VVCLSVDLKVLELTASCILMVVLKIMYINITVFVEFKKSTKKFEFENVVKNNSH